MDYKSTEESGVTRVLVPHDDELKQQFGHFITFIARGTRVALRDGTDAEFLMARSPLASVNLLTLKLDPFDSDEPDMVRRRVGKGTVIYSATDLGDGYQLHKRRSEEHTSELQSLVDLVCRLLPEKKKKQHSTR